MSAFIVLCVVFSCLTLGGCSVIKAPYNIVKGTYYGVKGAYELTAGTTRLAYTVGKFTFKVAKAPLDWSLGNKDIEKIDGISPKEAIRQGRVKNAPYTVKGKTYYPMSVRPYGIIKAV